jgi:hypothetical protein
VTESSMPTRMTMGPSVPSSNAAASVTKELFHPNGPWFTPRASAPRPRTR